MDDIELEIRQFLVGNGLVLGGTADNDTPEVTIYGDTIMRMLMAMSDPVGVAEFTTYLLAVRAAAL